MKKTLSVLLALLLVMSIWSVALIPVGAEETDAPSVWDGTANIKWYFDGKAEGLGNYDLNSAADLAGLAYLVNASQSAACYTGVYYDANYDVLGYRLGSADAAYADLSLIYTPTAGDGSQVTNGEAFTWQNVYLNVDVVLNEGNAADWATNPPTYKWQPIGGACGLSATKWYGFDGQFDGRGHTVSGMYVSYSLSTDALGVGLFGIIGYEVNAGVSNVTVENFYAKSPWCASGLIGRTKKLVAVDNCLVKNGYVVSDNDQTGALIGGAYNAASITNCGVDNVSIKGADYIGGMIGVSVGYTIDVTDSYFIGSIECDYQLGVIVGRKKDGTIKLKNVYAIAEGVELAPGQKTASMGTGVVYGFAADNSVVNVKAENYFYVQNLTAASGTVWDIGTTGTKEVTMAHLTGEMAKATLNGFDFDTVWKTVENGTPVIELRGDEGGDENTDNNDNNNNDNNNENTNNNNNNQQSGDNTNQNDTTNKSDKTDKTETTAATTEATADEGKSGCGGVVGFSGLMLTAILAGAAVMLKKED